jgi:hemerythrin
MEPGTSISIIGENRFFESQFAFKSENELMAQSTYQNDSAKPRIHTHFSSRSPTVDDLSRNNKEKTGRFLLRSTWV